MIEYTDRGFAVYTQFKDLNGHQIDIRESSLATEPAVRIYYDNSLNAYRDPVSGQDVPACLHLSVDNARQLRDALNEFLESDRHE